MDRNLNSPDPVPDTPKPQRAPLLLAGLILLAALLVTWTLWRDAQRQIVRDMRAEFEFEARQSARRLAERMATYEQVARGAQAFVLAAPEAGRGQFRHYVESLRLEDKYPGIQGLAIALLVRPEALAAHVRGMRAAGFSDYAVRPGGPRPVYSAIVQIEPFRGLNLRALGFDMYAEPIRHEAMARARDTGQAAASGKLVLIQENGPRKQSGLVMYLPLYARGMPLDTVEQRRAAILGWIGAPFRMDDLMAGLGGERGADLLLTIYDGERTVPEARMFGPGAGTPAAARAPLFAVRRTIDVAGRRWTLDLRSGPGFEARIDASRPRGIAVAGAGAGLLLALLVWTLASGRKRALGLARAMTARLRASEFRWKYALEGAGDGVWDLDMENGAVMYSKRWKGMLGYAEHELRDDTAEFERLLHPDDRARALAVGDAFLRGETENYSCQFRMRARDGGWRWILARAMAVRRDAQGRVLRSIGTHTDITPAKQAEQALRDTNAHLAAERGRVQVILDNSHDAFVAADADGRVTDWNACAEHTFGWPRAEALGRDLGGLILPPALRAEFDFRRFAAGDAALPDRVVEVEALHRDGRAVPIELALARFPAAEGHAVSAFIRDVSERRRARQRETERTRALEDAREALQHAQKLEAVGKLTGGVAHDFNNVLQIIAGSIQLLRHLLPGDAAVDKRLDAMQGAVDRGAKLSSQLLAFARRQPLQPAIVNLARVVRNMDDLLQRALGEAVRMHTGAEDGLWNVLADPGQLENVILNLAINARDAMPQGGDLRIEMRNARLGDEEARRLSGLAPGDHVMLAVADTGAGMPQAVLEQAFEPFFTTKPAGEGTGLGLSMAYGFVRQSGGQIRIDSAVGHGTTVRIYLPRSLQGESALPAAPAEPAAGGSETILAVEDDADVRAAVVGMLADLGYRVLIAHDGESALALVRGGARVDLLFTDVVMPGPVGAPQLAQAVRALLPDVAVLYTSGYTRNALVTGGRLEEGVQLLSKPYGRDQLARRVRQVLALRAGA